MKIVHDINEAELREKMAPFISLELDKELRVRLNAEFNTGAYGYKQGPGYLKIQELVAARLEESTATIDAAMIEARFNKLFDQYYNEALDYALDREARKAAHMTAVKMAKRRVKEMQEK